MPSIAEAAGLAYSDLRRVLVAAPWLLNVVFLICLAISLVEAALVAPRVPETLPNPLSLAVDTAFSFLTTPFLIIIHRFIILEEAPTGYALSPAESRFMRYFGWTVGFSVVSFVIVAVIVSLPRDTPGAVGMAALFLFFLVMIRLTLLFPAIAVDAPGANWRAAFADTQGRVWRILVTGVLVILPPGVVVLIMMGLDSTLSDNGGPLWRVFYLFVTNSLALASSSLFVAVASRLYLWMADEVTRSGAG